MGRKMSKQYKMRTISFICLLGVLYVVGCKKDDWYDAKSDKQLAVPTTLKDMQALLDNARVFNTANPRQGEIASDGHYVSDARARTLTDNDRNAYTWSREQPNELVLDWINSISSGSYRRIYYANVILDGLAEMRIEPNEMSKKEQWNDIRGQALFHRSDAFYKLSQVFTPAYEKSTADRKLGIPLRLESDINIPSTRSTISQTYDQVINDLMEAKDLLPTFSLLKTRPSKVAVFASLARIYLSMEDYEKAFIYAGQCLDSFNVLLNYKLLNSAASTNQIMPYNPELIFYSALGGTVPIIFSNILIDQSLFNSYNDFDLRKKIFFNKNATTGLITYKGTYCGQGFDDCFSGLATDEVILIRAECYARQGNALEAMKDLNTLLRTRWATTYTDMTAANAEDALMKVLEERKKELILRGLRWSDLRRLNRDSRFAVTLTRKVGDKTYTLEPNSDKYTFPIPDNIIRLSGIEQNPGWE